MRKPSIIEFVTDPNLLGLSLSEAQEVCLRAIYGLELAGQEQRDIWDLIAGARPYLEGHAYAEAMVISGARGGKDSRIAAPVVLYEALFGGHERRVAKGEKGTIVLVAQDAKAVDIAFGYVRSYLEQSPVLRQMLDGEPLAASLTLTNGLEVKCFPCTMRSMRGYSIPCAVLDELAFFRLEGQADSDVEIQASVRRGMVAFDDPDDPTPRTKLIKISTPYMRSGVVADDFMKSFGKPDPDLLVLRATSRLMNPMIGEARMAREHRLDPVRFRREYEAEFVDDVLAFLPQHLVDGALRPGRRDLPYRDGVRYTMAVDAAGGGACHFTAAVTHTEGSGADRRVVQDLIFGRPTRGPGTVDLEAIVAEMAAIAKRYRVREVYADRYSQDWVAQAFRRHGIKYVMDHGLDKSEAYLEVEPLFTEGRIEILDHALQRRELLNLEKRPLPKNKWRVDHPTSKGSDHDDYANALCLAAAIASRRRRRMFEDLAEEYYRRYGMPAGPEPEHVTPEELAHRARLDGERVERTRLAWRCRECRREFIAAVGACPACSGASYRIEHVTEPPASGSWWCRRCRAVFQGLATGASCPRCNLPGAPATEAAETRVMVERRLREQAEAEAEARAEEARRRSQRWRCRAAGCGAAFTGPLGICPGCGCPAQRLEGFNCPVCSSVFEAEAGGSARCPGCGSERGPDGWWSPLRPA